MHAGSFAKFPAIAAVTWLAAATRVGNPIVICVRIVGALVLFPDMPP